MPGEEREEKVKSVYTKHLYEMAASVFNRLAQKLCGCLFAIQQQSSMLQQHQRDSTKVVLLQCNV